MSSSTALQVTCFALVFLAGCTLCSDSKIKVTIVNGESKLPENCTFVNTCTFKHLSCRILALLLKQPISPAYKADLDDALKDLKSSKLETAAVLHFNENFTDAFVAKMALGEDADSETVESGQIQAWIAPEQADQLPLYLQTAFDQFVKDIKRACAWSEDDFGGLYNFDNPIKYNSV